MPSWNGDHIAMQDRWADIAANESAWQFWTALRERCFACAAIALPGMPVIGDPVLASYKNLRATMLAAAQYFVRRFQNDGVVNYWPEGLYVIDSCTRHPNQPGPPVTPLISNTYDAIIFPPPNQFSRRFHRLIYTLSQTGANGERAKFISFTGGTGEIFNGVRTTDPFFGSAAFTPVIEQANDGKIFDRVAGAWVLSADQVTAPTIIEEGGVSQMYRGDLHDGKLANELRSAMNQLVRTIGYYNGAGAGDPILSRIGVLTPSFLGSMDQSGTHPLHRIMPSANGSTVSAADADTIYDAQAATATTSGGHSQKHHDHWTFGDHLPHRWYVDTSQNDFVVPSHPTLGAMPNPLNESRNIHYFIITSATTEWDTQTILDLLQDVWHEKGPSAPGSNATNIVGPQIGDVTTHPPDWPVAPVDGNGARGWSLQYACMILDWEIGLGFQFSSLTP